jgi:hypothetical protein
MLCGQNVEFVVVLQVTILLSGVNQAQGQGHMNVVMKLLFSQRL